MKEIIYTAREGVCGMEKPIKALVAVIIAAMFALILTVTVPAAAWADDGSTGTASASMSGDCSAAGDGSVTWELTQNNDDSSNPTYTLAIKGSGAMADYPNWNNQGQEDTRPWASYMPKVSKIEVGEGVTHIGNRALHFKERIGQGDRENCPELTISLPESLTSIGDEAMTFANIKTIDIPSKVETMGDSVFYECKNLTEVTGASSLNKVGDYCFWMSSLSKMGMSSLEVIGKRAFAKTPLELVSVPSAQTVGEYSFGECTSLKSIAFGSDAVLADQVIWGDTSLEFVDFAGAQVKLGKPIDSSKQPLKFGDGNYPNLKEVLGLGGATDESDWGRMFTGCANLERVDFGGAKATLGNWMFSSCTNLKSVDGIQNVESLGIGVFNNCQNLSYLKIPAKLKTVASDGASWFVTNSTGIQVLDFTTVEDLSSVAFNVTGNLSPKSGACIYVANASDADTIAAYASPNRIPVLVVNGGSIDGSKAGFDAVINPGYKVEWYSDSSCQNKVSDTVISPESGKTYYAKWVENVVASGDCSTAGDGSVTWKLVQTSDDAVNPTYTLKISGSGAMANYATGGSVPWNGYKVGISSIVVSDGVTSLGDRSFMGCSNLTNVDVADSVVLYGTNCFNGCTSLSALNIGKNVTTIKQLGISTCTSLVDLTVDSDNPNYTAINGWLYEFPSDGTACLLQVPGGVAATLNEVSVPDELTFNGKSYKVTSVGKVDDVDGGYVLSGTKNATSVALGANVVTVGANAFNGCTKITSINLGGVSEFGTASFIGCTGLTSVELGNFVTAIPNSLFQGCSSLASVVIPDGVKSIGRYAFASTAISEFNIPHDTESVGDYAFNSCKSLKKVTGGESLTLLKTVGEKNQGAVFMGAPVEEFDVVGAESLEFPNNTFGQISSPDSLVYFSLENGDISGLKLQSKDKLTSVHLGEGVKTIPESAFKGQASLKTVEILGAESIGTSAFNGCAIRNLTLPDSVATIGKLAFGSNDNLSVARLSSGLTSLGTSAFDADTSLIALDMTKVSAADFLPSDNVMINRSSGKLAIVYVASGDVLDAWKAAPLGTSDKTAVANANGGVFPSDVSFEEGALATPTKSGYTFGGWYDNANFIGAAAISAKGGASYYAKWGNEITFVANDGTDVTATQFVNENDSDAILNTNTFTREGYRFNGWNTQADGSGDSVAVDAKVSSLNSKTLYAQWVKQVEKPSAAPGQSLTYNGENQTYVINEANTGDSDWYELSGNVSKEAGDNYVAKATLKPGAEWVDETTDSLEFSYSIAKKEIGIPEADTNTFTYNGAAQTYNVVEKNEGDSSWYIVEGNTKTDAGIYTVTVALKDTANTVWSDSSLGSKSYNFVINPADSATEPSGDGTTQDNPLKTTYGKTVTFAVAITQQPVSDVATQDAGIGGGNADEPGKNKVGFYYNGNLLGDFANYDATNGTATFEYDTTSQLIPAGSVQMIDVKFGGSDNLNSSEGKLYIEIAKAPQNLTFEKATVTQHVGSVVNALSGAEVQPSYSSSDTSVATVGADGTVTIVAPGKTTITATAQETGWFNAATASYILTVSEHALGSYVYNNTNPEKGHWQECAECDYATNVEAHQFGDWVVTKEASATEPGERTHTCNVCGYTVAETIAANGKVNTDNSNADNANNTTTTTSTTSATTAKTSMAATGDNTIGAVVVIAVVGLIALSGAVYAFRRRNN